MFGRIVEKLRRSYRRRGIHGTVRFAFDKLTQPLLELTPSRRKSRQLKEQQDREFDERYNVDTGGIIQLNKLSIPGSTWECGAPYWAIEPELFARLVGEPAISHRDFTFIDFGSGKGRALLLASEFPFKKVIGVEFSPELHEIAQRNIRTFRSERQQCREIELVCTDALQYPLPDGPGVYYFFNPFVKEIMEGVVARIERSYRERPREIYVLYANALFGEVWDRASSFRKIAATGEYTIYQTARHQQAQALRRIEFDVASPPHAPRRNRTPSELSI